MRCLYTYVRGWDQSNHGGSFYLHDQTKASPVLVICHHLALMPMVHTITSIISTRIPQHKFTTV